MAAYWAAVSGSFSSPPRPCSYFFDKMALASGSENIAAMCRSPRAMSVAVAAAVWSTSADRWRALHVPDA